MVNKKNFIFGIVLGILLINIAMISAQALYCCEKHESGSWCLNAPEEECDTSGGLRAVPTSCESTSYCRLGTCINTKDGVCMENTPSIRCNTEYGGLWKEGEPNEIPQCQLGCCLIGDQAAFVTQTRCKKLSSLYGLETNYRTDIQSEIQCIASASPKVKGACVFEKEYERTCLLLTKKECQEMVAEFHEGYLCSATNLNTTCGGSTKTTCVEGRDEIYFLDTCGNLANVYDSSHKEDYDGNYWTYIAGRKGVEVCSPASETCGNCDYFSGTTCKTVGGEHVCKDLSCEYKGDTYQHGETWCAKGAEGVSRIEVEGGEIQEKTFKPDEENVPGGRYFRLVCYNGDVTVEPCADFRQEICIQSEVNTFKTAACRVNMWQDCYSQDNQKDCENPDKRDCKMIEEFSILKDEGGKSLFMDEEGDTIEASCVPKYAPGFDFWEAGGDAESMCSLASTTCVVDYEKGLFEFNKTKKGNVVPNEECMKECIIEDCGVASHVWEQMKPEIFRKGKKALVGECRQNCYDECVADCVDEDGNLKDSWVDKMNEMCISLGDCGSKTNYIGEEGYYEPDDLIIKEETEEEEDGGILGFG